MTYSFLVELFSPDGEMTDDLFVEFGFDKIPLYGSFILAFGLAIITTVSVQLFLVPRQRSTIEGKYATHSL